MPSRSQPQLRAAARRWLPGGPADWLEAAAVITLLAAMALLCLHSIRRESPVYDEVAHLPAGVAYWQRHDLRLNPEHPPLFKLLAAWPDRHARIDYSAPAWQCSSAYGCADEWTIGREFFAKWNAHPRRLLWRARLMMLALTLLMGLVLYRYGRALGERWGGVLSLSLFVASPFFLANGPLVLNDVCLALFCVMATWTFASLLNRPGPWRALAFSLSAAAALLTKFDAGLLLPVFLLLWLWETRRPSPEHEAPRPEQAAARWIGVSVLAIAGMVDAVETYFGWNTPVHRLQTLSTTGGWMFRRLFPAMRAHAFLRHLLLPPMLYLEGMWDVVENSQRPGYLLGHHLPHGSLWYFPVLFLFKMTPGFLVALVLLAALALAVHRYRLGMIVASSHLPHVRGVILLGGVFLVAAIVSRLNIGLRHCSVPIAALTLLTALIPPCVRRLVAGRHRLILGAISAVLVGASFVSTLAAAPWYLSYFNPLIGTTPKYLIAGDSNLDWGQSLPALADFLRQRHARTVHIDYFGSVPARLYVPGAIPWSCELRRPRIGGWVAVSASRLAAMSLPGQCDWLFLYPSRALAGGSLYVFELPQRK